MSKECVDDRMETKRPRGSHCAARDHDVNKK